MKIFVINLRRSAERRATMIGQLRRAGLVFEFVEAVDGEAMAEDDQRAAVAEAIYAERADIRRPGAIGCALSHRAVYRRMVDEGIEQAIVLEDDILLAPDFAASIPAIAATLRDDEVLLFHFQSDLPVHLTSAGAVALPGGRRVLAMERFVYFGSTIGYAMTRAVAGRLLALQTPLANIADNWVFFRERGVMRDFRLTVPFLVEHAGFDSTIFSRTASPGLSARLVRWFEAQVGPVAVALRRLRRYRARAREQYTVDGRR